jgi:hypothetical protein
MANGWKITAIVFMILFVVNALLFVYITRVGLEEIEKEEECKINICEDADAYNFIDNICFCYEGDEVIHQERVK